MSRATLLTRMVSISLCRYCLRTRVTHLWSGPRFGQLRHKTYEARLPVPEVKPPSRDVVQKDLLIYVHRRGGEVIIKTAGVIVFSLILASQGFTFGGISEEMKRKHEIKRQHAKLTTGATEEPQKDKRFWDIDIIGFKGGKYLKVISVFCYGAAALLLLPIIYMPPRYIRSVVSMKGGAKICLNTYAPFGTSRHVVLPVHKVYAPSLYEVGKATFISTVNHRIPFYLSDKGEVLNKELLATVLTRAGKL